MGRVRLLLTLLLVSISSVSCGGGFFDTFLLLNSTALGGLKYFDMANDYAPNPNLHNANLGTYNCSSGSLILQGGQAKTFQNNGYFLRSVSFFYNVYPLLSPSAPSFSNFNLTDRGPCCVLSNGDRFWETTSPLSINLLDHPAIVDSGVYVLEIHVRGLGNNGINIFDNRGGQNYIATFTVQGCPVRAGFYDTFAVFNYGNATNFFYDLSTNTVANPNFQDALISTIDCNSNFILRAQAKTFQNRNKVINQVTVFYRVYLNSTSPSEISKIGFGSFDLSFNSEFPNCQVPGCTFFGDRVWQDVARDVSIPTDGWVTQSGIYAIELYLVGQAQGGLPIRDDLNGQNHKAYVNIEGCRPDRGTFSTSTLAYTGLTSGALVFPDEFETNNLNDFTFSCTNANSLRFTTVQINTTQSAGFNITSNVLVYRLVQGQNQGTWRSVPLDLASTSGNLKSWTKTVNLSPFTAGLLDIQLDGDFTFEFYYVASGTGGLPIYQPPGGTDVFTLWIKAEDCLNKAGFFDTFVVFQLQNGTNQYFDLITNTANPNFTGDFPGSPYNCTNGRLILKGAQAKTYQNSGISVNSLQLRWRIYNVNSGPVPFNTIDIPFISGCCRFPGDKFWENIGESIDLLRNGVVQSSGTYRIDVFLIASVSGSTSATILDDNSYSVTFTTQFCQDEGRFTSTLVTINSIERSAASLGANLGPVNCQSTALILNEVKASTNESGSVIFNSVDVFYRSYLNDPEAIQGAFQSLSLTAGTNNGRARNWGQVVSLPLLDFPILRNADYQVEFFFRANSLTGGPNNGPVSITDNNEGFFYSAPVTVNGCVSGGFIFDSSILIGGSFYDLSFDSASPDFHNVVLGSVNCSTASIAIQGAQLQTLTQGAFTFQTISVVYTAYPFSGSVVTPYLSGNFTLSASGTTWSSSSQTIQLVQADLTPGTYLVKVSITGVSSTGVVVSDDRNGQGYIAQFTCAEPPAAPIPFTPTVPTLSTDAPTQPAGTTAAPVGTTKPSKGAGAAVGPWIGLLALMMIVIMW